MARDFYQSAVLPSRSEIFRELARESHAAVRGSHRDPNAIARILERIEEVRRELNAPASAPIHRWLDNLRRDLLGGPELNPSAG